MLQRILLSPDGDSGNPPTQTAPTVLTGTKTEAELNLEAELKAERESHATTQSEKKQREMRISELEDELHRLRQLQSVPPNPAPAKKSSTRLTFIEDEDEE